MDTFSKCERSEIMRAVRSTATGPERKFESILRALGLSFKRQAVTLPGTPDFLLRESKLVVFVHGCFWHAHKNCKRAILPASNTTYWNRKIEQNRRRDRRARTALRKKGWRTVVIWECKLGDAQSVARRLLKLTSPNPSRKKLS